MNREPSGAGDANAELERLRGEMGTVQRRLMEAYPMAALGRLLAAVVHEINTPIGSILSNNDVVQRSLATLQALLSQCRQAGQPPPERTIEILETLRSLAAVDKIACERISSVIRSLKTCARVDQAERRKVDLRRCLVDTLKLTSCQFQQRIRVETEIDDLPEIDGYAQLLNQVFLNVLVNAGQAIEGPGTIRVRARREGEQVLVTVADDGAGIRPEDAPKVFLPGFSTKPVGVGTGLGLAISRQIVEDVHHGRIEFDSQVGVGTTFRIRLPIVAPTPTIG
jgi:signal transduction histidine kinase